MFMPQFAEDANGTHVAHVPTVAAITQGTSNSNLKFATDDTRFNKQRNTKRHVDLQELAERISYRR